MNIIALDIGDKRIGIAVNDPVCNIPLPFQTYNRKHLNDDIAYILSIAKMRNAQVIVCGMPYNYDGTDSYQTIKTKKFVTALSNVTDLKVEIQDERFTTLDAREILIEADIKREKRKQLIDKVAASYILESYLKKLV